MNEAKLTKDEIKKLALSGIGLIALVYVYLTFFLAPLNKSRAAAETTIADLQDKIASSKTEVAKAANLEQQAAAAMTRFATLKSLNPEGAPLAWFPPRMKSFFASQQVEKTSTRLEGTSPYKQPEMAEWSRYSWIIDLAQTDFTTLGKALAELENSEPLLAVSRLSIKAVTDNPQFQQVSLTANATIMKR